MSLRGNIEGRWKILQSGETLTTRTITYTYDPLYRLTGATYSDGTAFEYEYDSVGNVLTRTQTIAAVEAVTSYDYDAANQLETAQTSGQSTVWYYTYDANGSLTEITPNGTTPAAGARRYTYNAVRQLIRAEQHDGTTGSPSIFPHIQKSAPYPGPDGQCHYLCRWHSVRAPSTSATIYENGPKSASATNFDPSSATIFGAWCQELWRQCQ